MDLKERDLEENIKHNPFDSLLNTIVSSSSDYSETPERAWIWGIVVGWKDDSLKEFEHRFTVWNKKDSERLKKMHDVFVKAARENGGKLYE